MKIVQLTVFYFEVILSQKKYKKHIILSVETKCETHIFHVKFVPSNELKGEIPLSMMFPLKNHFFTIAIPLVLGPMKNGSHTIKGLSVKPAMEGPQPSGQPCPHYTQKQ